MTNTLTPPQPASLRSAGKLKSGPGAERINQAFEDFLNAAVPRGLIVGQMLLEQRYALMTFGGKAKNDPTKSNEDQFGKWLEANCPKISVRTAYNWMKGAENAAKAVWPGRSVELIESGCIEVESEVMPISQVLETTEGTSGTKGELKQAYFDFAADKTMKDCIGGVFLDGNDPTAITRAHNGRTAKGAGGGGDVADLLKTLADAGLEPTDEALNGLGERIGFQLQRMAVPSPDAQTTSDDLEAKDTPHVTTDHVNAIAAQHAAALGGALRGNFADALKIINESTSPQECNANLKAYFADWRPNQIIRALEPALQACAAHGAVAGVSAK